MKNTASFLLIVALVIPFTAHHAAAALVWLDTAPASPGNGLRILGPEPGNATTPVVNEDKALNLRVVDGTGQGVAVTQWTSDNPKIAKVTKKGVLKGIQYGFALVTASTSRGPVSAFVAVARVTPRRGAMAQGDTKADTGGNVYLSSPTRHVIYRATAVTASVLAGSTGNSGFADGVGSEARFNVPTGLAVDNRADGGVYVADSMNSCIRKISPSGRVTVVLGTPQVEGTMFGDATPVSEAVMRGPSGVASVGRDFYFADTENHAIYYANFQKGEVRLLCGSPDEPGLTDGAFRTARFNRPTGLAISASGRVLAVADTGNNVIRLVGLTEDADGNVRGEVSTLGVGSSARGVEMAKAWRGDDPGDAIAFTGPKSVSFDATENVYVVDETGASVVTRPNGELPEKVDLAQPGFLGDPASVTVRGTQAFVLDESAAGDDQAILVAEVGAPRIDRVTPSTGGLAGGEPVVIRGQNFSKEAVVTIGGAQVTDYRVRSSRRIELTAPPQTAPGGRTLTVLTRGGAAQTLFAVQAKPLSALAPGEITTVAGGIPYIGDGGSAVSANIGSPEKLAFDGSGNLYIADTGNHRVRRVDVTGTITTVAGTGEKGYDGDDKPATSARLNTPSGVAVDGAGNVYIADTGNRRIRRVDTSGRITTVAGTGGYGYDGDDKPATEAALADPNAVAADASGNVYIADTYNNRIRRVDTTGRITTVAGTGNAGYDGDDKPATTAGLNLPRGVTVDAAGNVYIADVSNDRIRRVDPTGQITTVAGTGTRGFDGDGGPAIAAALDEPGDVAVDGSGGLFIAEHGNRRIRLVDTAGRITTVAGSGGRGYDGDDKPATSASLSSLRGMAVDGSGNVYIGDTDSHRIRRVDAAGQISTVAGTGQFGYDGDDKPATSARLYEPEGIAFDRSAGFYIADTHNGRIRRVNASGQITTIAGTSDYGYNGDDQPATSARLYGPRAIAFDRQSNLFIADADNNRVRRVDVTGQITTVAGTGIPGYDGDDKPAISARISGPLSIAIDRSGNLYLTDQSRIRRVDAMGRITTVAGTGEDGYDEDNKPAATARLNHPGGVAVDGSGNLYIADTNNHRVRRVDTSGRITTVAGTGEEGYDGDGGPATSARIYRPQDVAVDDSGNLYFAGQYDRRIRRVDPMGRIWTVAGTGDNGYYGDEKPAIEAHLGGRTGLAVDGRGNLYIADTSNNAIRVIRQPAAAVSSSLARSALESGAQRLSGYLPSSMSGGIQSDASRRFPNSAIHLPRSRELGRELRAPEHPRHRVSGARGIGVAIAREPIRGCLQCGATLMPYV